MPVCLACFHLGPGKTVSSMSNSLRISDMATRNAASLPERRERCTEFQMHGGDAGRNVVDFTEHKLIRYASKTHDSQQKLVLMAMIDDYRNGNIAVAWRRGQPVWVKVTKEN
jgi:hypothetical protein